MRTTKDSRGPCRSDEDGKVEEQLRDESVWSRLGPYRKSTVNGLAGSAAFPRVRLAPYSVLQIT